MQRLHVGHAVLVLGIAAACADPVSNPRAQQDSVLSQSASGDRSDERNGASNGGHHIAVLDDCDRNDLGWAPTGGCTLRRGKVSVEEFNLLLGSSLSLAVVGHPAWRNEPSYLKVDVGKKVRAKNEGGRFHTFTRVALFGGGRVPPLRQGLTMAPECALAPGAVDPNGIAPGAKLDVAGLTLGINRYMCCIHPWMRALIKVAASTSNDR